MHMQVCTCSHTSVCLRFWRAGITPSMEGHSSALAEINPVSCKGTRHGCSNTRLNWATGSTQQIVQRESRVNKNIFCTQINIPSQFEKQTIPFNYIFLFKQALWKWVTPVKWHPAPWFSGSIPPEQWIWPVSRTPWLPHPQNNHSPLTK